MAEFNLNDLCQEFGKLCDGFNDEWTANSKLLALDFMGKCLFEISPAAHAARKNSKDDMRWTIHFGNNLVNICTFFKSPPSCIQPRIFNGNELILTVEQAILLAGVCMEKYIPLAEFDKLVLPPLVAEVFVKKDITKIAEELSISVEKVTQTLVSSSIRSGYHLTHSSCAVAVVYAFHAVENATKREHVKAKIIKEYSRWGKHYNEAEFIVYRKHCFAVQFDAFFNLGVQAFPPTNSAQPSVSERHEIITKMSETQFCDNYFS